MAMGAVRAHRGAKAIFDTATDEEAADRLCQRADGTGIVVGRILAIGNRHGFGKLFPGRKNASSPARLLPEGKLHPWMITSHPAWQFLLVCCRRLQLVIKGNA